MKKTILYIVSCLTSAIFFILGIVFRTPIAASTASVVAMLCAFVLPFLFYFLQKLAGKSFLKQIQKKNVSEMHTYLLQHRTDAEKTAVIEQKRLRTIRRLTDGYAIFLWLLGAMIAFFSGVATARTTSFAFYAWFYGALVFGCAYSRIRFYRNSSLKDYIGHITQKDYPTLYALAKRAADAVGYNDDVVLLLSVGCNASIAQEKDRCLLQLGVVLLNVTSEEELYQIMLHEFAHISSATAAVNKEMKYQYWIDEKAQHPFLPLQLDHRMFSAFNLQYAFHHMLFSYATALMHETAADEAMLRYGNADIAASALAKLHYETLFRWEDNIQDFTPFCASEEQPRGQQRRFLQDFQAAIEARREFWNELAMKEIIANNASHPTLKMRLESLGIHSIQLVESCSSEEYFAECSKALDYVDDQVYTLNAETYAKDREENYLKPLSFIEAWEEKGKPISPEEYADVINNLISLGRKTEAEEICDRALAELHENSSLYASFMKGCCLLYRHDESGIDLIYKAMENNGNYIEDGLEAIGQFCCLTGREEALLEYRKRAAVLLQKNVDESSHAGVLLRSDKLSAEALPEGMLEEILGYILSVDEGIIQNIYLVRKTVNENFFTSAFIIHFYGGTDQQRDEIMHKIFLYLDSHPTQWQFSLFDYFAVRDVKVEKIQGSRVYSKPNDGLLTNV